MCLATGVTQVKMASTDMDLFSLSYQLITKTAQTVDATTVQIFTNNAYIQGGELLGEV